MRQHWRSFPFQLTFITVLPLTLLLVGIAIGSLLLHQRAMRTLVGERDQRVVTATASTLTEQLTNRLTAVQHIASHLTDDNTILIDDPQFDQGLAIFDRGENLVYATEQTAVWLPFAEQTLDNIDNLVMVQDSSLLLAITQSEDGQTIVGAFSVASIADHALRAMSQPEEAIAAYLVTANGRLLHYAGSSPPTSDTLAQHPAVQMGQHQTSGTTYFEVGEQEHVAAFSTIHPTDWLLIIEEPWQSVADPLLEATEIAPFLLVLPLVLTLLALWFGATQVVQPLRDLQAQATQLGWGDFEAITQPVKGIPEIHRLQAELIHMAHKVQKAQQGLRGYLGAVTIGQEEERRRLARDLHDETIQSLIALNQRLQLAQMAQPDDNKLDEMQQMTTQIIADLRRLTHALRPSYLEDLGLIPALEMLVRETNRMGETAVTFHCSGSLRRLATEVELALYRMAQEGLSNILRHAKATQASVALHFSPTVTLIIQDNGQGFTVPESYTELAPLGHFGLLGIYERAELMGANLTVESSPKETTLTVIYPR